MLPSVTTPNRPQATAAATSATFGSLLLAALHFVRDAFRQTVTAIVHPRRWTLRWATFGVLAVLYVVLSILIVVPNTPVLRFDSYLVNLHLWHKHPHWYPYISVVVGFGQRWIVTYCLQLVFVYFALRARSNRPLVLFAAALILLNTSVGIAKYALGRVGPILENSPHKIFILGADIFPSGHVSNTVMFWALLAWAAPKYRKSLAAFAVVISICVGLGTVFMRTHWFSDVVGGWLAGAMVLLALPSVLPLADRLADQGVQWIRAALATRPVLHDRVRRVMNWLTARIPADPVYAEQATRTGRPQRAGTGAVQQ